MKLNQFSRILVAGLIALMFAVTPVSAQTQKPKSTPEKNSSGAASASCDGALDIVPGKPVSFVRKRRPAKKNEKLNAPADAKSQQKKIADSKPGNQ